MSESREVYGRLDSIERLTIKKGNGILFVPVENIVFIEKQGKKCMLYDGSQTYSIEMTLKKLEQRLSNDFMRTHHSFIVNFK